MPNLLTYWPFHRRYERFCTLAASGQLGGPEMHELNAHVGRCRSCRELLESINQVTVQVLPLLAGNKIEATEAEPPPGMRGRFLDRLALEESNLRTPGDSLDAFEHVLPPVLEIRPPALSATPKPRPEHSVWWRTLAAVTASAALGITGFYLGRQTGRPAIQTPAALSNLTNTAVPEGRAASGERIDQLEHQKKSLEAELNLIKSKLALSAAERDSLRQQLSEATAKQSAENRGPERVPGQTNDGEDTKLQAAMLGSEVDRLKQKLRSSEEQFETERQMTLQLSEKLQITESDLGRERDLKSAKGEMGDLVGSRNLHIVDVYDADSSGKQQSAFGRVFYVENQSLVFYAYDLDRPGEFKTNVVFHVWGGKAGVKEVTHSLGILRKDDPGQHRWAMTFDDTKVLSEINSVFVTAESSGKSYDSPRGRKVLYAYFGGPPNHP